MLTEKYKDEFFEGRRKARAEKNMFKNELRLIPDMMIDTDVPNGL